MMIDVQVKPTETELYNMWKERYEDIANEKKEAKREAVRKKEIKENE